MPFAAVGVAKRSEQSAACIKFQVFVQQDVKPEHMATYNLYFAQACQCAIAITWHRRISMLPNF
eukprot:2763805-Pleurochrysis_carterae.AAC.1